MKSCLTNCRVRVRIPRPGLGSGLEAMARPWAGKPLRPICAIACLFAAFVMPVSVWSPARADTEPRGFAAHALTLRAEVVDGRGAPVLAHIPGGLAQGSLAELWPPFFENTMVALGRLRSPAPRALYYNPLLDIAVSTIWEKRKGGWRLTVIRALPGGTLCRPAGRCAVAPALGDGRREAVRSSGRDRRGPPRGLPPRAPPEGEGGGADRHDLRRRCRRCTGHRGRA